MSIRHARAADLPAIIAIYNASIPGRMATADVNEGFQRWGLLPDVAELDGVERDLAILGLRVAPPQQRGAGT